jgi:hypothetical protein
MNAGWAAAVDLAPTIGSVASRQEPFFARIEQTSTPCAEALGSSHVHVVMAFLSLVRELRQFPRAVAVVAALAIVAGLLTAFRISGLGLESKRYEAGYARGAAVVDTLRSQTVDSAPQGGSITALTDHAVLLADLMTRSPLREEIAARAGIPPGHLLTERPMNLLEKRLTNREVSQSTVTAADRDAYVMRVGANPLVEGSSPIIGIDVRAPDPRAAARLADTAFTVLRAHIDDVASSGPRPSVPIKVEQLEPATAEAVRVGPSPVLAILAAVAVFALGSATIIAVTRLRVGLRRRRFAL